MGEGPTGDVFPGGRCGHLMEATREENVEHPMTVREEKAQEFDLLV